MKKHITAYRFVDLMRSFLSTLEKAAERECWPAHELAKAIALAPAEMRKQLEEQGFTVADEREVLAAAVVKP